MMNNGNVSVNFKKQVFVAAVLRRFWAFWGLNLRQNNADKTGGCFGKRTIMK